MKRRTFLISTAVLSLSLLLSACSRPLTPVTPSSSQSAGATDTQAPSGVLSTFSAADLDGNTVDQSVLAEHDLTMINVWATYCGPCLHEMPDLGELAKEYSDQGVQFIGIVSDVLDQDGTPSETQLSTAKDIASSTGAAYTHLVPAGDLLGLLYQIKSVPTTFFVDKDGNQVGQTYVGARTKDSWKQVIDSTLAEVKE